jgi:nucleoside-diphosphate-sugar epimerase
MSHSIQNTVAVMKEKGIKRIVLMTARGVGDSAREVPWLFSLIVKISNVSYAYADHAAQEKILEDSGLDWTVVRPTMLTDKNEDVSVLYNIKGEGKIKTSISRNAVAHFIVEAIDKGEFIKQKPGLSNK